MIENKLPKEYIILDHVIDLNLNEFQVSCSNTKTLSVTNIDSNIWFEEFCDRVELSINKKIFLPVLRLCDGEYIFLIGKNIASKRINLFKRIIINLKEYVKQLINYRLVAGGENRYKSGSYSANERKDVLKSYISDIREISKSGILALHFSWSDVPFTEALWPKIKSIFDLNEIRINSENYVPFYFVYALLSGSKSRLVFENRNILVVNGAQGEKKIRIINNLQKKGVNNVVWISISEERSLFDIIDLENIDQNVDLALIGAGVGKLNILKQLSVLSIPCIDIGFYFEILANEQLRFERTMCFTDNDLKSL